jgi:hypothetical protein
MKKFNFGNTKQDKTDNSAFFAQKEPEPASEKESPFDEDITEIVENCWQSAKGSNKKDLFFIVLMNAVQVQQQRMMIAKLDQLISAVSKKEVSD